MAGVPVKGVTSVEDLRNAVLAVKGWLKPPQDEYEVGCWEVGRAVPVGTG